MKKIIYYRTPKCGSSSIIDAIEINIHKINVTKQKKLKQDKQMIEFVNEAFSFDFENFDYEKMK